MMKNLLAKIRGAKPEQRCRAIAEVYNHANMLLYNLESQLNEVGSNLDVAIFDAACDEVEGFLDELNKILNPELQKLLKILKPRFEKNMHRHEDMQWENVQERLSEADPKRLWSLNEMERTGGEPDVVGFDKKSGELIFQDRSPETPTGRRNYVYDKNAEAYLKERFPEETCNGNVVDMAAQMGVALLDEQEYREAQQVDKLDQDSWSWLKTPFDKRRRGVALIGCRNEDSASVNDGNSYSHDDETGWRGSLSI